MNPGINNSAIKNATPTRNHISEGERFIIFSILIINVVNALARIIIYSYIIAKNYEALNRSALILLQRNNSDFNLSCIINYSNTTTT
jgi:hypothetical protein